MAIDNNVIRKCLAGVFVYMYCFLCGGKNHDKHEAIAGCAGEHKHGQRVHGTVLNECNEVERKGRVANWCGGYEACAFICARLCVKSKEKPCGMVGCEQTLEAERGRHERSGVKPGTAAVRAEKEEEQGV